jgi:hypothetical protein
MKENCAALGLDADRLAGDGPVLTIAARITAGSRAHGSRIRDINMDTIPSMALSASSGASRGKQ